MLNKLYFKLTKQKREKRCIDDSKLKIAIIQKKANSDAYSYSPFYKIK